MSTTETDRQQGNIPDEYPTLVRLYSPAEGIGLRVFCPNLGKTLLGREVSESAGISLASDTRCSRHHAVVHLATGLAGHVATLKDCDSKNGTFVNGVRIQRSLLSDGDVLRIGNTLFLFRLASSQQVDGEIPSLVGRSPAVCRLRHGLTELAPSSAPVLLLGEPGVGKELGARALHERSRRPGPFVPCNCAGITETLADSLLFGHERGAFSGAHDNREGLFRAAEGGTLFLDEVAELPLAVQAKLLRALQESEILPLGRTRPLRINVRIVAATNRDLQQAVARGSFRDDLLSRLKGAIITLPPLRARREDILCLLGHCLGRRVNLTPRLAEALVLYHWPHNVRELTHLANALRQVADTAQELDLPAVQERLIPINNPGPLLQGEAPYALSGSSEPMDPAVRGASKPSSVPALSKEVLERLGQESGWNVSKIAALVGRSRRQVRRLLDRYGLGTRAGALSADPADPNEGE